MADNLQTEIELVKRDINQLNQVIGKLDTAIDKLSEVATSINQMLAVQENKIDTQDKQIDKNVEVIHDRIEKHSEEVTVEIEKSHRVIMDEIKALREDQALHHQLVSERLNKLEQWRWVVIGGACVAGWAIANIPWNAMF